MSKEEWIRSDCQSVNANNNNDNKQIQHESWWLKQSA